MDQSASEDRDLESGGTCCDSDNISGYKSSNHMLGRLRSGFFGYDGYVNGECSSSTYSKSRTSIDDSHDNIELLIEKYSEPSKERVPLLEKKRLKEKRKNSFRKASKPPRPPKGPTLDVLDMKFAMEISELAMKKRARIRRIKALRKMKAEIASSSSSSPSSSSSFSGSLAAMVVTLLFFVVLVKGIYSTHDSSGNLLGSPNPAIAAHSLISVRFFNSSQ